MVLPLDETPEKQEYCDYHNEKKENENKRIGCKCTAKMRTTRCEHQVWLGEYTTEKTLKKETYRKKIMVRCEKKGRLRKDAMPFFYHKYVLCDEHYPEHKEYADRRCGICGSSHRSCCC